MPGDVVLGQGLFDEEQSEAVELGQMRTVVAGVRGVGVDLERNRVAERLAKNAHGLDVGARLDLQLDANVALVQVATDGANECVDVVVDSDRDARRHAIDDRADGGGQRHVVGPQLGVQHRGLDGGLRHAVVLHGLEKPGHVGGVHGPTIVPQQSRNEVMDHHVMRTLDVLTGVERIVPGDAFAPAIALVGDRPHQQDATVVLGAERGAKRGDEWKSDHAELETTHMDRFEVGQVRHRVSFLVRM